MAVRDRLIFMTDVCNWVIDIESGKIKSKFEAISIDKYLQSGVKVFLDSCHVEFFVKTFKNVPMIHKNNVLKNFIKANSSEHEDLNGWFIEKDKIQCVRIVDHSVLFSFRNIPLLATRTINNAVLSFVWNRPFSKFILPERVQRAKECKTGMYMDILTDQKVEHNIEGILSFPDTDSSIGTTQQSLDKIEFQKRSHNGWWIFIYNQSSEKETFRIYAGFKKAIMITRSINSEKVLLSEIDATIAYLVHCGLAEAESENVTKIALLNKQINLPNDVKLIIVENPENELILRAINSPITFVGSGVWRKANIFCKTVNKLEQIFLIFIPIIVMLSLVITLWCQGIQKKITILKNEITRFSARESDLEDNIDQQIKQIGWIGCKKDFCKLPSFLDHVCLCAVRYPFTLLEKLDEILDYPLDNIKWDCEKKIITFTIIDYPKDGSVEQSLRESFPDTNVFVKEENLILKVTLVFS